MKIFKFNNYGMTGINWLIEKYEGKQVDKKSIEALKEDIRNAYYNNQSIDFSTKGGVSCHLVDRDDLSNCEIVYN